MYATNVPWPYPSPAELPPVEVRSTWPSSRLPNADGSTPESLTAIVGALRDSASFVQSTAVCVTHGDRCAFVRERSTELGFTDTNKKIAATSEIFASTRIW